MGGADRGTAIQRGPAHGSNFDSSVPSATTHHQNHFVVRGRLKSSSPLRRLFSLSVDVADAVALPHIRRGPLFFLESPCSAQPVTWWARFLSFSSRFRPCIR